MVEPLPECRRSTGTGGIVMEQGRPELVIIDRVQRSITLNSTREFFGYGSQILLTEQAQHEFINWLWKNRKGEMIELMPKDVV